MTRIPDIVAAPHPSGNRIDLVWRNPDPSPYLGVRVVRREGTHPLTPDDGVVVAEGEAIASATDQGLKGETVYYYALFPYTGDPPVYQTDRYNRTSAMASGRYNMAGQMHELLPAIYHRYDAAPTPTEAALLAAADRGKGELLRFLEVVGGELDLLRSFARSTLDLYDIDRVDGRLLRLLAEWIGWKVDHRLEIASQRNEVRHAPEIYRTIGIIPTVESTVKRISGWESRTKEFVHNVFAANRPERLNIWERRRAQGGQQWTQPESPLSLDFAFEGRPATARDADGTLWLFYHTQRGGYWNIWGKTYRDDRPEPWSPSFPLTMGKRIDKYPSAVLHEGTLWLFWSSCDEGSGEWTVYFRTRPDGGEWSATMTFGPGRWPSAIVDSAGDLWLFRGERQGGLWRCCYSKLDGGVWSPTLAVPLDASGDTGVEDDLFVLFHPLEAPTRRIWVFWSRKLPASGPDPAGQTRSAIFMRTKGNLVADAGGWSAPVALSALPSEYHDREPAAFINPGGQLELFWSSDRGGSWGIWRRLLPAGAPQQVATDIYAQRTPLPVALGAETMLLYRSNRSITYTSATYTATDTTDFRYGGSTTVRATDSAKIALRGEFDDFQRYTYDNGGSGGRNRSDWYGRDTIGLYLSTDTLDPDKVEGGMTRIEQVLREFMPITDRAVPIVESDMQTEYVYTYSVPADPNPSFIADSHHDALISMIDDELPGPGEDFNDLLE